MSQTQLPGHPHVLPVLAARDDAPRGVFEKQFPELTRHATAINNRAGCA